MRAMSEQNYRAFFEEAMSQIHQEYKAAGREDEFTLWFNLSYVEDTISAITVSVASEFMWQQMNARGNVEKLRQKIAELTGQSITLRYMVRSQPIAPQPQDAASAGTLAQNGSFAASAASAPTAGTAAGTPPQAAPRVQQASAAEPAPASGYPRPAPAVYAQPREDAAGEDALPKHPQLSAEFTFDSFVPGENSEYAFNAVLAAAKNPGRSFNPIFLYGGVGLGKTHLMQALGNYIYKDNGGKKKICYISTESMMNEFTSSLLKKTTDDFKKRYRTADVLLLDDIHFVQNKKGLQEELFYIFESLYPLHKQMVFTCDRPISELKDIEDRLRSRFSRGLCIDLQPPNYETRKAIIEKKLSTLGKKLPADVVDYIAKNVQTNVRDLEGCLTKMIGYADLVKKEITIEIAQEQLRDTFSSPLSGTITIDVIQKVVADHYGISVADIKGKKRDRKYVIPRQNALYIAGQLTEYSLTDLGNEFGGRDHTTVMHSRNKVEDQLKTDSSLNATIQLLIREIKDYKK